MRRDVGLLRRMNAAAVLRALHSAESRSLRELAAAAGVVRNTAEEAVEGLVRAGLAAAVSPGDSLPRPVGRPAKQYRFRPDFGYAAGVDFGVDRVEVVITDLRGAGRGRVAETLDPDSSLGERVRAARAAVDRALRECEVDPGRLLCLGVATTGIVGANGVIVRSARLPYLDGTDLAAALAPADDVPVLIENDSRAATRAERWIGAATDADDVIHVIAGRVIHAAIVVDGRILYGTHGAAGEIAYLSETGWVAAHRAISRWPDPLAATCAAAASGDTHALALVEEAVHHLATGIAALALTVDPARVVVAGDLGCAGDVIVRPLQARLNELTLFPVPVVASTITENPMALGAVRLALDHIEQRLFTVDSPLLNGLFDA